MLAGASSSAGAAVAAAAAVVAVVGSNIDRELQVVPSAVQAVREIKAAAGAKPQKGERDFVRLDGVVTSDRHLATKQHKAAVEALKQAAKRGRGRTASSDAATAADTSGEQAGGRGRSRGRGRGRGRGRSISAAGEGEQPEAQPAAAGGSWRRGTRSRCCPGQQEEDAGGGRPSRARRQALDDMYSQEDGSEADCPEEESAGRRTALRVGWLWW